MIKGLLRGFLRTSGPHRASAGYVVQDAWMNLGPTAQTGDRSAMNAGWATLRSRATRYAASHVLEAMNLVDVASAGDDYEYRSAMHELTKAVYEFATSPSGRASAESRE